MIYFWYILPFLPIQVLSVPEVRYVPIPVPVIQHIVAQPEPEPSIKAPFAPITAIQDFI